MDIGDIVYLFYDAEFDIMARESKNVAKYNGMENRKSIFFVGPWLMRFEMLLIR